MTKNCNKCGETKHTNCFYEKAIVCKECRIKETTEWRNNNLKKRKIYEKDYAKNHKKDKQEYDKQYSIENADKIRRYNKLQRLLVLENRFAIWKAGAKQRGIEWTLNIENLKELPLICHYTNDQLTLEPEKTNTISIDRVDNTKGYHKNNIVLCCLSVNYMKQSLDVNTFISLCKKIVVNSS